MPRGQQVDFTVQSKDVIHDFWVPAFRMKIDAVPGIDTHLRVTPKTIGEYPVVCAELCGLGHSVMRQTAHVVEPAEFEQWLADRAAMGEGGGEEQGGGRDGRRGGARPTARPSSPTPAAAAATRWRTPARRAARAPTSTRCLAGKDEAFIEQSIVDPSAEIAQGFSDGLMPADLRRLAPAGGAGRAGEVPCRGDGMMEGPR